MVLRLFRDGPDRLLARLMHRWNIKTSGPPEPKYRTPNPAHSKRGPHSNVRLPLTLSHPVNTPGAMHTRLHHSCPDTLLRRPVAVQKRVCVREIEKEEGHVGLLMASLSLKGCSMCGCVCVCVTLDASPSCGVAILSLWSIPTPCSPLWPHQWTGTAGTEARSNKWHFAPFRADRCTLARSANGNTNQRIKPSKAPFRPHWGAKTHRPAHVPLVIEYGE